MSGYEMIVCRDERQAGRVREQVRGNPNIRVVSALHMRDDRGCAPRRITVCDGVDSGETAAAMVRWVNCCGVGN